MDHLLSITKIFRLLQWRCLRPATSYLKLVLMIYLFGKRIDITLVEIQNFKYREKNQHCVKSVQIRSYFCISCIWSEYRKIRTRKNSVFGHFSRSEFLFSYVFSKFSQVFWTNYQGSNQLQIIYYMQAHWKIQKWDSQT